eukprot:CAMPEP_0174274430 /NCGR_PEP_ID=MMETSP0439-20130205/57935_1 /TAXON_ID=0 /ORGANISM="Stereomyxa ramosa, Strain Chinc5" /LENGTH=825 /DNA_ID=CAMNT_0015366185 /DNA_START=230 /DNA_END=2707 /DNA_ORIENTATION=-
MNNYNTAMEIICGLNCNPIHRLKHLWQKVPNKLREPFLELEELMNPSNNWRNYRANLENIVLPTFPHLGIYLHDFTYIYDGNPRYLETLSDELEVNVDLHLLTNEYFKEILKFQSINYSNAIDDAIQRMLLGFYQYDVYNDDYLFQLSLQVKPSMWASFLDELCDSCTDLPEYESEETAEKVKSDDTETDTETSERTETDTNTEETGTETGTETETTDDSSCGTLGDATPRGLDLINFELDSPRSENSQSPSGEEERKKRVQSMTQGISFSDVTVQKRPSLKPAQSDPIRGRSGSLLGCTTVSVPVDLVPTFFRAEVVVQQFFSFAHQAHKKGTWDIFDERYVLLRASAIATNFIKTVQKTLKYEGTKVEEATAKMLHDFGVVIGKGDAYNFAQKMLLQGRIDPIASCASILAFSGWARMKVLQCRNSEFGTDKYVAIFDLQHSFEVERSSKTRCAFTEGFIRGWVNAILNSSNFVCCEISCKTTGEKDCRFVVCSQQDIKHVLEEAKYDFNHKINAFQPPQCACYKDENTAKPQVCWESVDITENTTEKQQELSNIEEKSTRIINSFFSYKILDPTIGNILFSDQRFIFIWGEAFAKKAMGMVSFLFEDKEQGAKFGLYFVYEFGNSLGYSDNKFYTTVKKKKGKVIKRQKGVESLFYLPTIFGQCGWGLMQIDFSKLCCEEGSFLFCFKIFSTLESSTFKNQESSDFSENTDVVKPKAKYQLQKQVQHIQDLDCPICCMTAGYVSGYVAACFSDEFSESFCPVCIETSCATLSGENYCEFVVADKREIKTVTLGAAKTQNLVLLEFFEPKNALPTLSCKVPPK